MMGVPLVLVLRAANKGLYAEMCLQLVVAVVCPESLRIAGRDGACPRKGRAQQACRRSSGAEKDRSWYVILVM
jgi:hypothetical protein